MIEYRRPSLDEAGIFAALHVQCWREAYKDIVPAELLAQVTPEKRIDMWRDVPVNPTRIVIGAYDEGIAVGLAVAGAPHDNIRENEDGQLAALYVLEKFHRLGIGRALVQQCAAQWLAMGGHSISLSVLAKNRTARTFYESMGARFLKSSVYGWDGVPIPTAIYIWDDLPALIGKDRQSLP